MRLYQIFTRLFGNGAEHPIANGSRADNGCGTLDGFTREAVKSIKDMGFTHVWITGIIDHATTTDYGTIDMPPSTASITKGRAGSPYAIRNFFDLAPDLAHDPANRKEAFLKCRDSLREQGLKLIIDFVPNHTAREYRPGNTPNPFVRDVREPGFHPNNFYFYLQGGLNLPFAPDYTENPAKATGNDAFTNTPSVNDWYETVKINYGRDPRTHQANYNPAPASWAFMTQVLLYWAEAGVDGFRCDMVDMVPNEFWKHAISVVRERFPHVLFIGESYNPGNYQPLISTGFDYLYDKVGVYDAIKDRLLGKTSVGSIGKALWDTRDFENNLLRFTENHDEPRLPSKQMFGKTAPALSMFFLTAAVGRQLMVYAGQEFGEKAEESEGFSGKDGKTTIFDYWSPGTLRRYYNKGKWDGAALLPQEKILKDQYKSILALHALLESQKLTKVYNLQTANPHGYGEANINDGFAILRTGTDNKPVLLVNSFTNKIERFTIVIPQAAYAFAGAPMVAEELVHISDARTEAMVESLGNEGVKVTITLGGYGCLAVRLSSRP
jgi:glycosidase